MVDSDEDFLSEELRRRQSRYSGSGGGDGGGGGDSGRGQPRSKEIRRLGLRTGTDAETGLAKLLFAENAQLREVEHQAAAFRGGRGGAPFFSGEDEEEEEESVEPTWRLRERMKTVSVALVLCLNIGTDPPDAVLVSPRARVECWLDPFASPSRQKALEAIGAALQSQYERWQSRARYRPVLDPTADELLRICAAMRRQARVDRVLIHLNGHGVPRPTVNGEIWVFNKNYTQYMPLNVCELRDATHSPAVYVLEFSGAGILLPHFAAAPRQTHQPATEKTGAESTPDLRPSRSDSHIASRSGGAQSQQQPPLPSTHQQTNRHETRNGSDDVLPSERGGGARANDDCIVLAPCGADETLPTDPRLPADLFTACLTTPISVALRWFVLQHPYSTGGDFALDYVEASVPGRLGDRELVTVLVHPPDFVEILAQSAVTAGKTPLGELNWIFTAVTDTIAWNALPAPLFQRLFRQDLLLASLFRNFLLAERVLKAYNCTPQTLPRLPPTADHPLWSAWDLAAEQCLAQLALGAVVPSPPMRDGSHAPPPPPPPTQSEQQQHVSAQSPPPSSGAETAHPSLSTAPETMMAETPVAPSLGSLVSGQCVGVDENGPFKDGREFRGLRGLATLPQTPLRQLEASSFFEEQLTGFEVWLRFGASRDALDSPPEQLPIVLQVLLSQAHRVRALVLLRRFLEHGARAVNLALCVGIFPYVLKLLQSPTLELRHPLVAIWAAILAFDDSCKLDLIKDSAHIHFVAHIVKLAELRKNYATVLAARAEPPHQLRQSPPPPSEPGAPSPPTQDFIDADELEDQALLSAFVLATVLRGDDAQLVKVACLQKRLDVALLELLRRRRDHYAGEKRRARLRRWLCLCAANLSEGCRAAKLAARKQIPIEPPSSETTSSLMDEVSNMVSSDPDPSARAAALRAVAAMVFADDSDADDAVGSSTPSSSSPRQRRTVERERDAARVARVVLGACRDASGFVRHEAALCVLTLALVTDHRRGLRDARNTETRSAPESADVPMVTEVAASTPTPKGAKSMGGESATPPRRRWRRLSTPASEPKSAYEDTWAAISELAIDPFESVANVARDVVEALSEEPERVVEHRLDALARTRSGVELWSRRRFAGEVRSLSIAQSLGDEARKVVRLVRNSLDGARLDEDERFHAVVDAEQAEDSVGVEAYLARDPLSRRGELLLYRLHRNRYTMREASALADRVRLALDDDHDEPSSTALSTLKFHQAATLENEGADMTRLLRFHPHEPYLLVVDQHDGLLLWDYEAADPAARWHNTPSPAAPMRAIEPSSWLGGISGAASASRRISPAHRLPHVGARVTAVEWLDASQQSLLCCGSDDGVVRIWKNLPLEERIDAESDLNSARDKLPPMRPDILTAFVAADDLAEPSVKYAGLVCCWAQAEGLLYCAGDSPMLRAFDARSEKLAHAQPVALDDPAKSATCLCAHPGAKLVFAGFSDGHLRAFDLRAKHYKPATAYARHHSAWIVHLSCHDVVASRELVSACLDGSVAFWDLRSHRSPLHAFDAQTSTMSAFVAHSKAPLLASGSHNQFIKFMARDSRQLNIIRYHEGVFLGQRIGPVTALAFHDSKLLCAAGSTDPTVGLYACNW